MREKEANLAPFQNPRPKAGPACAAFNRWAMGLAGCADSTPDFMAVGAYDGMAAIVHAVQATKGTMDGDDAVNVKDECKAA
jgi:hypothetical protein